MLTVCVAALTACFTMWRAMLGDFDIDATLGKGGDIEPTSIAMFVVFQALVVVLMMNLIIAIMAGSNACTRTCCWVLGTEAHACDWGRLIRKGQRKRDGRGPARARQDDRGHGAAL